jgi:hypothetical protein
LTHHSSKERGEFTDLTLAHDAGNFKIRRVVACPRSRFFEKACTGGLKVRRRHYDRVILLTIWWEESTGVIDLNEVPHLFLEKLVQFFHNMDYDDGIPLDADVSVLQLHARIFALADKYEILDLDSVAANKYSARCLTSWEPSEFLSSILDVYDGTPTSIFPLRRYACTVIRRNLLAMLNDKTISNYYDHAVTEHPDFAKDLLQSYVVDPVFKRCYVCSSHQRMEILQV